MQCLYTTAQRYKAQVRCTLGCGNYVGMIIYIRMKAVLYAAACGHDGKREKRTPAAGRRKTAASAR